MSDWKNVQYKDGKMRTGEGGGGGGSSTFAGLDDVSLDNLQNGQVPKYNSTTQKWENANESGGGGTVTDVEVDGVSVVNQQGVAEITMPSVPDELSDLSDVQFSNLTDHQPLRYNATSQKWVNGADNYPPLIYSDEEREVGVWRDGKPLYQKTIDCGALPNSTSKTINHNISNIDYIIKAEGYSLAPNINSIPIPFVNNDNSTSQLALITNDTSIILRTSVDRSSYTKTYITLYYTKTTDTAGSGTWNQQGGYAHHYSTDEKVIGTWVNGKPIYEKVWVLNTAASLIPNTFLSDLSIGWIVDLYLMLWDSSDMYKYYIAYNTASKKLTYYPSPDRWVYCLCAQYTKTTD